MKVSRSVVADVVAKRSLQLKPTKRLSKEVAAYLLSERRTNELAPLLRDVQQAWAEAGRVDITAISSHPLSAGVRRNITARVRKLYPQAKQVTIIEELDPSILGGVRLELADQQLDLSIETKLNTFKQLTVGKD